jgi:hypothetical protein
MKPKTIYSLLGPVIINDAKIVLASGHGQYTILIETEFEGKEKTVKLHSTDSELFDKAHGEADQFTILMKNGANMPIKDAVENYYNSL